MFPTLFEIGFFQLRVYSLMYVIGLLLVIYFTKKRGKDFGFSTDNTETMILIGFITALLFARLYYVFLKWDYYNMHPGQILAIWKGGLAIHGGVFGGFLGIVVYCRIKDKNPVVIGDIILPFLLLAQGIGRFGNFANGEAHGVPTYTPPSIIFQMKDGFREFWNSALSQMNLIDRPESVSYIKQIVQEKGAVPVSFEGKEYFLQEYVPWGISFPREIFSPAYQDFGSLPVHPTFFYEMILNFIGFAVMYYFWRKDEYIGTGKIVGMYFIAYGLIRGVVTFFRADDLMMGPFRAPHILSIVFIMIGLFFFSGYGKRVFGRVSKKSKS